MKNAGCLTMNADSFKFDRVVLTTNLSWTLRIQSVFTKCIKLTIYVKELRSLRTPEHVVRFLWTAVSSQNCYTAPLVFSPLTQKYVIVLSRVNKCIVKTACIPHGELAIDYNKTLLYVYFLCRLNATRSVASPAQVCKRENGHLPFRFMTARIEAFKNSDPFYVLLTHLLLSCRISITNLFNLLCLFMCAPGLNIYFQIKSYLSQSH